LSIAATTRSTVLFDEHSGVTEERAKHGDARFGLVVRAQRRELVMADFMFVGLTILFFLLAAAYVRGCEKL